MLVGWLAASWLASLCAVGRTTCWLAGWQADMQLADCLAVPDAGWLTGCSEPGCLAGGTRCWLVAWLAGWLAVPF